MARLSTCGDKGVSIPQEGVCDECAVFENRLEDLEDSMQVAQDNLQTLNDCCETVQDDIESMQGVDTALGNRVSIVENSLDGKQDQLTAGLNITINDNVISATNTDPLDFVYPVGSIYMSINSTSPANLFGGTWVQLKDTFLLAAGTTYTGGSTGGTPTVRLTAPQSGNQQQTVTTNWVEQTHSHSTGSSSSNSAYMIIQGNTTGISEARVAHASSGDRVVPAQTYNTTVDYARVTNTGGIVMGHNHTITITATDATQNHENMPPYLAVYMWYRTA